MRQEGSVSWTIVEGPMAADINCPQCGRENGAALHEAQHHNLNNVQCETGLSHTGYICYCGWRSENMCNTAAYNGR